MIAFYFLWLPYFTRNDIFIMSEFKNVDVVFLLKKLYMSEITDDKVFANRENIVNNRQKNQFCSIFFGYL